MADMAEGGKKRTLSPPFFFQHSTREEINRQGKTIFFSSKIRKFNVGYFTNQL
jgi:hypothetical protein